MTFSLKNLEMINIFKKIYYFMILNKTIEEIELILQKPIWMKKAEEIEMIPLLISSINSENYLEFNKIISTNEELINEILVLFDNTDINCYFDSNINLINGIFDIINHKTTEIDFLYDYDYNYYMKNIVLLNSFPFNNIIKSKKYKDYMIKYDMKIRIKKLTNIMKD